MAAPDSHKFARIMSAKTPPMIHPIVTMKAPPVEKPTLNDVMPPARMQMIVKEIAKLEKPCMRLASSCA